MFKSIKESWRLAEATELRKEFIDLIDHIRARGLTSDPIMKKMISNLLDNLEIEHGQDVFSLSEKGRKISADTLYKKARKIGRENFNVAAGMSLVAIALKASYLPGDDTEFVSHKCSLIINSAVNGDFDLNESVPVKTNKILLVSEKLMVGEMFRRILVRHEEFEYFFTTEINDLFYMADVNPDLIMLCTDFENIDIADVLNNLRSTSKKKHLPIIIFTDNADPNLKATCFKCDVDDYIILIPDEIELIARIRRAIKRKS
ncbi:MAG: hypothetical protein KAU29_04630 [Gammaproteobacteria bacterium]|nr:hypothetical protein [Gammaproteobacteria bacterium]